MIHIRSILSLVFSLMFLAGCVKPQDTPSAAGDDSKKAKASKEMTVKPDKKSDDENTDGRSTSNQVDDPKAPVTFQITSKLGVKTKVEVKQAKDRELLNYQYQAEDNTPRIMLNEGAGLFLVVPARYVKSIAAKEGEESVVAVTDNSKHVGKLMTTLETSPKMSDAYNGGPEDGWYDLRKAAEVVNLSPAVVKKRNTNRPRFTLKVAEKNSDDKLVYPQSRTFEVYAPKIGGSDGKFTVASGGDQLVANVVDFDRIVLLKDQNGGPYKLRITVKAPGSQEKSGEWAVPYAGIQFETVTGSAVVVSFFQDAEPDKFHSFILERKHLGTNSTSSK